MNYNVEKKMTIKLFCKNCKNEVEITTNSQELPNIPKTCEQCGNQLVVTNLDEIIKEDLRTQCRDKVNLLFKTYGIEYTCELLERNKNLPYIEYFFDVLREKGLKK